jgi:hypothetical protein
MTLSFCCQSAAFPLLLFGFVSGVTLTASAQDKTVIASQKVLTITREFTKPGKDGSPHEKTEGAFVHAMAQYKSTDHYYAVTSLSGPSRALFLSSYASFAALEAARMSVESNAPLSAALDSANTADGDLLSATESSVWVQREDLSLNPGFRVGARLEEITQFRIKPGHFKEWEDLVKLVLDGYKKGVPDAHWGAYEEAYGSPGGGFLIIVTMKSAAEIDANFAAGKKFQEAMGEDGMKKMALLEASCVESEQTNLFKINPKMSYPSEEFVQAEPAFWKAKP